MWRTFYPHLQFLCVMSTTATATSQENKQLKENCADISAKTPLAHGVVHKSPFFAPLSLVGTDFVLSFLFGAAPLKVEKKHGLKWLKMQFKGNLLLSLLLLLVGGVLKSLLLCTTPCARWCFLRRNLYFCMVLHIIIQAVLMLGSDWNMYLIQFIVINFICRQSPSRGCLN